MVYVATPSMLSKFPLNKKILLTKGMFKFPCDNISFEICGFSTSRCAYLNKQIILLLSALGKKIY